MRQRFTLLSSPAIAANTNAKQAVSALASRVSCSTFAQLKPSRNFSLDPPCAILSGTATRHARNDKRYAPSTPNNSPKPSAAPTSVSKRSPRPWPSPRKPPKPIAHNSPQPAQAAANAPSPASAHSLRSPTSGPFVRQHRQGRRRDSIRCQYPLSTSPRHHLVAKHQATTRRKDRRPFLQADRQEVRWSHRSPAPPLNRTPRSLAMLQRKQSRTGSGFLVRLRVSAMVPLSRTVSRPGQAGSKLTLLM